MEDAQRPAARPQVLASDLDGTLIPLDDRPENRAALETLRSELDTANVTLVFSTGRHFASVKDAIETQGLPSPEWIICDVGTSIFRRSGPQGSLEFELTADYHRELQSINAAMPLDELQQRLQPLVASGKLQLQEQEKQSRFKLSYYARTDSATRDATIAELHEHLRDWDAPYSMIDSVDPFNGDGLIDFLPREVSKAYALRWLAEHERWPQDGIVFAGDSGNDLAALTAGYLAIVVANADRQVAEAASQAHRDASWHDRLYLAEETATSGVLEGCRWHRMF